VREAIRWSHPDLHALHPNAIAAAADAVVRVAPVGGAGAEALAASVGEGDE
jgi:hypothetical protein